ncbi:MAG: archaetidylserine decarboxylase [Opitutaceae bacterium]|jgi:phosphatidylserine decarboxylase
MSTAAVRYFDRTTRTLKTEKIYGETWLRLIYGNPAGRLAAWLLVRRAVLSSVYGWKMKKRSSALRVLPFIVKYDIDVEEFAKSAFDYKSFNDFFCRALKPSARPIAPGERVAVIPADGRHLAFPNVDLADGFYAKGERFSLADLFGDFGAALYAGGSMLISRLCPVDCHHFHFPVSGVPDESRSLPGSLYSVNPIALRRNIRYLVSNKRQVTVIRSPGFGTVAMVEIGATNVGGIQQCFTPGKEVAKGDEKGFFSFGGSCVITIFEKGRIAFDSDLAEQSAGQIETFARMGDRLGVAP